MKSAIPNVLTIAGVDPSGGAGIVADVKAISAQRAYACAVVAALTAQNTHGVTGVLAIDPAFVRQQLDTLYADVRIDALKIGMIGQRAVIEAVADRIAPQPTPHRVLDPVMVAKSGDTLLEKAAIGALTRNSAAAGYGHHAEPAGSRRATRSTSGRDDQGDVSGG